MPLGRDEALLHVAYKPFTGRLHSPGEYCCTGVTLPGGECLRVQLSLQGGEMDVQRAGIDIGALRELEVFLLVEAFRPSELKRTLVMGGTT